MSFAFACSLSRRIYGLTDPFAPHSVRIRTGFCIKMLDFSPDEPEPARAAEMLERRLGLGSAEHDVRRTPVERMVSRD